MANRQNLKRSLLAVALLSSPVPLVAGACTPANKKPITAAELQRDAERAYEAALAEFLDSNWEYAFLLMDEVRRNYSYTKYARIAQLRLADIAFNQEKYPEAIAEYKAYVSDHPNDPEVPYARFRVIRSQFLASSNSFFQPPLEERDLTNVKEAYAAIRAFLADYPNYKSGEELRYMYQSVSGMLMRYELYVARFYLNVDRFNAAVRRVQYALRTYNATGLEPEAIVLLGETYLKMKERRKARAMFEHVLTTFPESAFTRPAQAFLQHLDASKSRAN